ncbi:MAG: hypothetical protein H6Q13_1195 [Bacteroidetes bacterium]|nr:hypothetical protein [Bacteroidota bacterium]
MKKNMTFTLTGWFVLSILLFSLWGCTRRDLEEESSSVGSVTLNFNWMNLETDDELPTGMQLYFYSSDGTILTREATSSGFTGTLPSGTYQVLAYNSDGQNVTQRNLSSYEEAEVYAPVYTRSSSYLYQPSHCYGVGLALFTVVSGDSASATMIPRNFVRRAVIKVEAGSYADQISSCSGIMSGFSPGAYISSGELVGESGTLYFDTEKGSTSFTGEASFFGKDTGEQNALHLDLQMVAGSEQFLNVDITDLLKDVNTVEVDIQIDVTIEVIDSETILSGITIKPWEEVDGGGGEVR